MAAVAVTANNTRIEDSEAITGWSSRGGGAGAAAEAPLAYQGTNTVNRKVTSSTGAGFQYDVTSDSGVNQDMTTTALRTWMVKFIITDAGGLQTSDGVRIIIGDSTNEYAFVVAGTASIKSAYDAYLLRSATIIIPIDPNISGYRDSTHSSGTVTLTAVNTFGIEAAFSNATAKAENVGLDAIDLGTGLTLTGGDGVDADGVWADFVDADEGTVNNRWGFASSIYGTSGTLVFFGTLTIGSATVTAFTDLSALILWPDGLFAAGFSRVFADLQSASTVITDGSTHTSLGTINTEDTRTDYTWSGTAGTGTASHILNNFRNYTMTSAVTLDGANIQIVDLTQASGTIQNSTIRTNSASGVAVLDDPTFANISDTSFVQTGSGHAIEITSTGSHTLDALLFSGYGSDGANDAAIYNNSGGAITLNITNGGGTPTVRNGTGASTTIVNARTLTLTGLANPTQVYLVNTSLPETDSGFVLDSQNVTTGTYTYAFNAGVNISALYRLVSLNEVIIEQDVTLNNDNISIPINQGVDRVYENP